MKPASSTVQRIGRYKMRTAAFVLCVVGSVVFTIVTALSVSDFLRILFGDESGLSATTVPSGNLATNALQWLYVRLVALGREKALVGFSLLLFVVYGLKNVFSYASAVLAASLRVRVVRDVRNDLYEKMLRLPVAYFARTSKGETLARFSGDVSEYDENVLASLQMLTTAAISIALYLFMLFYLDVKMTLVVLCAFPVVAFVISGITRKLRRKSATLQEKNALLMSQVEETMAGIKVLKSYTALDFFNQRFVERDEDYTKLRVKVYRRIYLASPVSDFLGNSIVVAILLYGSMLIFGGSSLSPELFISYIMLFVLMIAPSKDLTTAVAQMRKGKACTERLEEFLSLPETVKDKADVQVFDGLHDSIELRHVWFRYDAAAGQVEALPWVLRDVSLRIAQGSKVALVGASGSGKSTLVDLLMRYAECGQGVIECDGQPLDFYSLASWRSHIGIVSQHTVLFNASVYDNIAFGCASATPQQVEQAARDAGAHDFIMSLPNGYDTNIGDDGTLLSGGQRQRLSIARALVRQPDILILDEATSALDTETERAVQQALERLMQGRTVVMIAHRLSTVVRADEILVMQEGAIVERGTHAELLALGGHYRRMWDYGATAAAAEAMSVLTPIQPTYI
ncbi:MAG: ABC transporter ATP-binding protein [Bacteroidales bacterium]|nr:ABC transporter ATP-binding protein [Bacteroidales bacterium]